MFVMHVMFARCDATGRPGSGAGAGVDDATGWQAHQGIPGSYPKGTSRLCIGCYVPERENRVTALTSRTR